MDSKDIYDMLVARLGAESVLGYTEAGAGIRDPFVTLAALDLSMVCLFLRDEPELRFDFCQSITALDAGERLACVYHLYSYTHRHTLVLKASTPRGEPLLPSCAQIWPAADWYEREAYDLFGIRFEGHPDLRRLLLPEDWQGHPMRKDWREGVEVHGMPTSRESLLDLLEEAT